MALYCGIDLHANNHVIVVIDDNDKVLVSKRVGNDLNQTLQILAPWREQLSAVAVESTFNWYWLVDGLMAADYRVRLVHTTAVKTYSGLKRRDDVQDAFWLAHLMRLDILPSGYIYPASERPLRDLLRRRMHLMRQHTRNLLSLQNQLWRSSGVKPSANELKGLGEDFASEVPLLTRQALRSTWQVLQTLDQEIGEIERVIKAQVRLRPRYQSLLTAPGIGFVLASVIMLESGDVARFKGPGNFASYSRCVDSCHLSNGKRKGEGNRKNGNKYLAWAFVEAAQFARRYCPTAQRFYERKRMRTNTSVATKALAHKLARACYFIMRDGVEFDEKKLFS